MKKKGSSGKQGLLDLDEPDQCIEEGELWARARGFRFPAGVDEAGRGPLAGPVVAGAVYLSRQSHNILLESGIDDSKKLSEKKRKHLYELIKEHGFHGTGVVDSEEIDRINILEATFRAMNIAIRNLCDQLSEIEPDLILVDGNFLIRPHPLPGIPQHPMIKGDRRSVSIAAASVLAKVYRDAIMDNYDDIYPGYGFRRHKGYASREHLEALRQIGPSPVHRLSFRGVLQENGSSGAGISA